MKFLAAFLVLSLVATATWAAAVDADSDSKAQTTALTTVTCSGGPIGLCGVLKIVLCLLGNILYYILSIRWACQQRSDGVSILAALNSLCGQIYALVLILLAGGFSNSQCNGYRLTLNGLISAIVIIIDNLLGLGTGQTWCCTSPLGGLGGLINGLVTAVILFLTGGCNHDCGLLGDLFNLCLFLCQSCQSQLH